uniref:Uncharacterized protein n=1 Tax=Arundo donax TaxID=35708 RepID=A0A0A8YJ18_ARUDO
MFLVTTFKKFRLARNSCSLQIRTLSFLSAWFCYCIGYIDPTRKAFWKLMSYRKNHASTTHASDV